MNGFKQACRIYGGLGEIEDLARGIHARLPGRQRGAKSAAQPRRAILVILASVFQCGFLAAQTPGPEILRTDAARAASSLRPSISLAEDAAVRPAASLLAPKLKNDAEYGEQVILTRKAHWEPWSLSLDAQLFYTNNVALVPRGEKGDFYLRSGALLQYTNRIAGDWFLNADVSDYFYAHDRYHEFDFALIRGEVGVLKGVPWLGGAYFSAHYVWYDITEPDFASSAFSEHLASFGLQKVWKISRGQQVTAGATADISLAGEPEAPRRSEFAGFLGHKLRLTEKFTVKTGYRLAYYDYSKVDRQDWNHTLLLGCTYDFASWGRLEAAASGSWNRSNTDIFDYDNLITGVGLTLHLEW